MRSRHLNTKIALKKPSHKSVLLRPSHSSAAVGLQRKKDKRSQEVIQKKNSPSSPFRGILLFILSTKYRNSFLVFIRYQLCVIEL